MRTGIRERALIVHLWSSRQSESDREDTGSEFRELVKTAGVAPVGEAGYEVRRKTPAWLMGKGQAEEVARSCQTLKVDVVLVDEDLKPMQQRNLEQVTECKVIDRTGVILDIFAQRAKSQEGQIQVELAQLNYLMPRLTGRTIQSQLAGGIGTRGPGEQKLEMDRRRIRDRMTFLRKGIERVKRHRALQRTGRRDIPLPLVTLVGYTNAGKSTLLNQLSGAQLFTQDLLFATLDPTTRRVRLPRHGEVLVTDTVGFIRELSVHLVAAFKATLEEVAQSDLLIQVLDVSHHAIKEHDVIVRGVLKELGAGEISCLTVLNKIDRLAASDRAAWERCFPGAISVSAKTGEGCKMLLSEVERRLERRRMHVSLRIPYTEGRVQALLHQFAIIENETYDSRGMKVEAWVDPKFASRLKPYQVTGRKK